MSSTRQDFRLAEIGKIITGKTPSTSRSDFFGGYIPFITPSDMDGRKIISQTERTLTEEGANAVAGSIIPEQAVIVSCIGSDMGKVAIAGKRCVTNQQINSIVVDETRFDPEFVYYNLLHRKDEIQSMAGGSAQPILNKSAFSEITISFPTIEQQKGVVGILKTFDDKIELNRKHNVTLEQIAKVLFESWFVDFAPTKAKAKGRQPEGMDAEIAALFPGEFEEREMVRVPKGWGIRTIGDLVQAVGGTTPDTKQPKFWEQGVHPWATPKDLSGLSSPTLLNTERALTDEGLKRISSGLLPVGSVLMSSRAPIGYLAISEIPVAINQGFIAMIPKEGVSNLFVLLWAKANQQSIVERANGSTFLEISKSNFRPIPVICPSPDVMKAFDYLVRPLYQRIVNNERETKRLIDIRDTLLPKLISGQVRIPDAAS